MPVSNVADSHFSTLTHSSFCLQICHITAFKRSCNHGHEPQTDLLQVMCLCRAILKVPPSKVRDADNCAATCLQHPVPGPQVPSWPPCILTEMRWTINFIADELSCNHPHVEQPYSVQCFTCNAGVVYHSDLPQDANDWKSPTTLNPKP